MFVVLRQVVYVYIVVGPCAGERGESFCKALKKTTTKCARAL